MSTVFHLALAIWLIVVAVEDWRKLEVSNWLTVPPLLAVVIWRCLAGGGGWIIGVAFVLFLIGVQWARLVWPAVALLGLCLYPATAVGLEPTIGAWLFCYILYTMGVIGGADAKVVMMLTALFPDSRLTWLLLLCWFGVALVRLVIRHDGWAGLKQAIRGLASFQVSQTEGLSQHPALPSVALAGLLYLLILRLGSNAIH